jgi:hypothetical protein
MKRLFGFLLLILGLGGGGLLGMWAVIMDLQILHALGGLWAAVLGFFIFPAMLVFAPLYAGAIYGYWVPLWIGLLSMVFYPLIGLGVYLIGETNS